MIYKLSCEYSNTGRSAQLGSFNSSGEAIQKAQEFMKLGYVEEVTSNVIYLSPLHRVDHFVIKAVETK